MEDAIKVALLHLLKSQDSSSSEKYVDVFYLTWYLLYNYSVSDIDDIVLSYVNGILEDLVEEENPEQNFDSEDFLEMILAYLPQLDGIDVKSLIILLKPLNNVCWIQEKRVTEWMMNLVADVIKSKKQTSVSSLDIKMLIEETTNKSSVKKTRSVSETSEPEMVSSKKRSPRLSETSLDCSEAEAGLEAGVARLLEMFPTCCKVEAIHCLTIMGGDLERAAQMVLTRSAINPIWSEYVTSQYLYINLTFT